MTDLQTRCVEAMARAIIGRGFPLGGEWVEMTIANHTPKWFDGRKAIAKDALTALLAELDAAGWQVVPKEATREMKMAGVTDENEWRRMPMPEVRMKLNWAAMLAAAPKPFGGGK